MLVLEKLDLYTVLSLPSKSYDELHEDQEELEEELDDNGEQAEDQKKENNDVISPGIPCPKSAGGIRKYQEHVPTGLVLEKLFGGKVSLAATLLQDHPMTIGKNHNSLF